MSVKPPGSNSLPLLKNVGAAPIVYFDSIPVFGTYGGMIEIEVAARMLMPKPDGSVMVDMGCSGHLRCSPNAAVNLIDALTKTLDMLAKANKEQSEKLAN